MIFCHLIFQKGTLFYGTLKVPEDVAFYDTLAPKQGTGYRGKKRSENAQPQNEILCSKGAWGRCPQQADGRKCECVLTLALLANISNNRNGPCAAAEN